MKNFFLNIPVITTLVSLACFSSVLVSPADFWPAGLLIYAILPLIIFNFLLLLFLIIKRSDALLWPVIAIISGWYFVTVSMHFNINKEVIQSNSDLTVLSINAKLFRVSNTYSKFSSEMISWIENDTMDIKCIQEYSTNNKWDALDITGKMLAKKYYSHVMDMALPGTDHHPGMAIFSKYPIINKGSILLNKHSVNNIMFADIKIKDKIIRVYNVHLASMQIPLDALEEPNNIIQKGKMLFNKLKAGSIKRSHEIDALIEHTGHSPYPYIICGDFNEIPYGYNYKTLSKKYTCSFDEIGEGFGFTLNSKMFFLRIDHHFTSKEIEPVFFRVDRNMNLSDHYPTRGSYKLQH